MPGPASLLVTAVAKAEHLIAILVFMAAANTAAMFSKHPHVEGCIAVIIEEEGAPPAQTTRTGKRLPAPSQRYDTSPTYL